MAYNTKCQVCKARNQIMKRCTRCHDVYYCSKECQIDDWKTHRSICQKTSNNNTEVDLPTKAYLHDGSIFNESRPEENIAVHHGPVIDFHKEAKELQKKSELETKPLNLNFAYLHCNQYRYDLPVLDESQIVYEITVRCNKMKQNIKIQSTWSGEEIFKTFSNKLKIPHEKIKVIYKGKILTYDTIALVMTNKAVFQVIGEHTANEEGLEIGDVDLLMKQTGVDRNEAVCALRKTCDVVDAIIELGKK